MASGRGGGGAGGSSFVGGGGGGAAAGVGLGVYSASPMPNYRSLSPVSPRAPPSSAEFKTVTALGLVTSSSSSPAAGEAVAASASASVRVVQAEPSFMEKAVREGVSGVVGTVVSALFVYVRQLLPVIPSHRSHPAHPLAKALLALCCSVVGRSDSKLLFFRCCVLLQPMDFLKTRLQVPGASAKYSGTFDAARKIAAAEGWRALYTGLNSELLRGSLQNFLYFYWYTYLKATARARLAAAAAAASTTVTAVAAAAVADAAAGTGKQQQTGKKEAPLSTNASPIA
jgi:hypothetical protein